ncbi:hypothetical protein ACPV40_01010 [Vibrio alfacsensis]|uniref:hypothetical protein n=1 Tax=Vibrio alfacsensis TaxID=1074311 RepID=UPI0040698F6F
MINESLNEASSPAGADQFLDEASIGPVQRVRLLLGLEKKIVEVLIDCRLRSEDMQSDVIELIFIAEIDICIDPNGKL